MIEEYKHEKISGGKGFLYIVLLVAAIYALGFLARIVAVLTGIAWMDYALYVVFALGATLIVSRRLQGYIYGLDGGTLLISRVIGSKEKLLLEVELSELRWSGPFEELPPEHAGKSIQKLTFDKKSSAWCIVFANKRGKEYVGLFSPTEKFRAQMAARISSAKRGKGRTDGETQEGVEAAGQQQ